MGVMFEEILIMRFPRPVSKEICRKHVVGNLGKPENLATISLGLPRFATRFIILQV